MEQKTRQAPREYAARCEAPKNMPKRDALIKNICNRYKFVQEKVLNVRTGNEKGILLRD